MIRKIIQNNNGYALLLTFGIVILFTVLGLSLMTLTMSGTAKNSSREDNTQALNLAEKGIDFIVNEINTHLSDFTKEGKSRDDFIGELEKFNQNNTRYKCTFDSKGNLINGLKITTSNSNKDISLACIKSVHEVSDVNGLNDLKKNLEIISFGKVDGKNKQLTTFIEIGADHIPEQLKYTLTSNGNVHLNGAVQITGDLRYKGNLTTYNKAHIVKGSHYWVDSLKPSIKSTSSRSNPRIVVSRNSKFYHVKDWVNASTLYSGIHNMNLTYLTMETDVSKLFDNTVFDKVPTVVTTDSNINDVDVSAKKNSYNYTRNSANDLNSKRDEYIIPSGTYHNKRFLIYRSSNCWGLCSDSYSPLNNNNTFELKGSYEFNQLATSANLKIAGSSNSTTKVEIKNTLYVEGDLIIEGNVELSGSIFVNGRLRVHDSNLKTNALIYVNNTSSYNCTILGRNSTCEPVDIQYSTINSLTYINNNNQLANGTLVIFSNGKVKLSNNSTSSLHDEPSEIYGFFYSGKELEIYGSGSNMKIHGGIYGSRITLHATRGNTQETPPSRYDTRYNNYNGLYVFKDTIQNDISTKNSNQLVGDTRCNFTNKSNQKNCYDYHSRLQLHYNEDIVSTYIELNRKEELIYNVDPPKIVNRD